MEKERFKISTKISFGGRYYFGDFVHAKNIETVKRTKVYRHYKKQLNEGKILGLEIKSF